VRTIVYDLLQRLADTDDLTGPVVEFGALRVPGQAHLPPIRSMFPGYAFTGVDMDSGLGVDQRQDLHQLGLKDESVGTALLLDTIEHVEHPRLALRELCRCMKPDGVLLLTSHFFFPIHQFPSDYWRFTAEGIASLLSEFGSSYGGEAGLRLFPHTVVGLAGGPKVSPERWQRLSAVVRQWQADGATSWKEHALNLLPPALVQRGYKRYADSAAHRPRRSRKLSR
jgi:SAM-dependent methyltransferase